MNDKFMKTALILGAVLLINIIHWFVVFGELGFGASIWAMPGQYLALIVVLVSIGIFKSGGSLPSGWRVASLVLLIISLLITLIYWLAELFTLKYLGQAFGAHAYIGIIVDFIGVALTILYLAKANRA